MTNPTNSADDGFLNALHDTQQQVQALAAQYGQVSKETQEQLARLTRELEAVRRERDALREQVTDLQREFDEVRSERDIYLHSLHHILQRPFSFTKEELEEMQRTRVPFSDIMAALEQE
jgi:uncharacterized coiled-coil DUF342 family protein